MVCPALSISRPVSHLLRAGRFIAGARVLAVFEHVCNLVAADGEVIALVTPAVGNGPLNIVVDAPDGAWAGLVSQPAEHRDNAILIGQARIDLRDATTWEPRPDWTELRQHRDQLPASIEQLSRWIEQTGHVHGWLALLYPSHPPLPSSETVALDTARQLVGELMDALAANDHARIVQASARLTGLGHGLTPSGDDFLVGVMAWLWLAGVGQDVILSDVGQDAILSYANQTTLLSAALLRAAGRGEFGAAWHELFAALAAADSASIKQATHRILTCGHTSGADALAGFLMTARRLTSA